MRLVLALSLDGRLAPAEGGAAQIGGPGDRQVLEEALTWADAALIGAQTLRLHGSTCLIHRPELLARRSAAGLTQQPLAIVVSRSGMLPRQLPFFRQPLQRGLLLLDPLDPARPASDWPPPLPSALGFERSWVCLGWGEALAQLQAAGLERLLVLGGATLATSLLVENRLDELQLTLCPKLLGGPHSWLGSTAQLAVATDWRLLEHRPLAGNELLLRYRRN